MKEGLNRMDIKAYHNMLEDEVPLKKIAKRLHTKVKVLKRLTPKAIEKANQNKKLRDDKVKEMKDTNKEKVEIIAAAANQVLGN
jgi:hypothetical protein